MGSILPRSRRQAIVHPASTGHPSRDPTAGRAGGWQVIQARLPEVAGALAAAGAAAFDPVSLLPPGITDRAPRPGDERFGTLNARRPVLDHAMATAASGRIDVRRGVLVTGLLSDRPGHVTGVRLRSGPELRADLVIDAAGRRSPLPAWLRAIGAGRPAEEAEDSGFTYYTRFFRARDGEQPPPLRAGNLTAFDCYSILTLPSDARTWSTARRRSPACCRSAGSPTGGAPWSWTGPRPHHRRRPGPPGGAARGAAGHRPSPPPGPSRAGLLAMLR